MNTTITTGITSTKDGKKFRYTRFADSALMTNGTRKLVRVGYFVDNPYGEKFSSIKFDTIEEMKNAMNKKRSAKWFV